MSLNYVNNICYIKLYYNILKQFLKTNILNNNTNPNRQYIQAFYFLMNCDKSHC